MHLENPNSGLRNGMNFGGDSEPQMKLPVGFRFRPTDEELVVHYLKPKAFSLPLPASVIPHLDAFQTNPWDLPGDLKEKRYFFTIKKGDEKKIHRISTGSGYWKAIGKDKQIVAAGCKQAVGLKKTLVFYRGKGPHGRGLRTGWVMHEYRLLGCLTIPRTNSSYSTQKFIVQVGDWVVCRIHEKKIKKAKRRGFEDGGQHRFWPSVMDLKMEDSKELGPPEPCSSCSSDITEVVFAGDMDQEASSGR